MIFRLYSFYLIMPSKTKHKKTSSQKFRLDAKFNQPFKKKPTSPYKKACKQNSKVSHKRQGAFPSQIIGNLESTNADSKLNAQYSMPSLRSKQGSQINHRGSSKIVKQNLPYQVYNNTIGSDYQGGETQRFKSQLRWPSKNCRGSMLNTDICSEYGYSQLTYKKSDIQNESPKGKKKYSDQSQIQLLLAKYTKHIEKPSIMAYSKQKNQNFRTLSTDDKSQKKFQFSKKHKNRRKKQSSTNKLILFGSPQEKRISNNKNKSLKTRRKKNFSKTLLPDYFGCLSINKVQSKIQRVKQKEDRSLTKKTKQSTNKTSRGNEHRKSQQILLMTRVKQDFASLKEIPKNVHP